ncbi:MAG TPA: hypothetical protein VK503_09345 [Candidatus Bathyarchaeia archaeon]|nr:hypothetical protein [Candidatus Bathyarchaeia archaeon]
MFKNSPVYSDLNLWYLRGIEDQVEIPDGAGFQLGGLDLFPLNILSSQNILKSPIACTYLPALRNHCIVDETQPSKLILLNIITRHSEEELVFPNASVVCLCTYENELFTLDAAGSRIIRLRVGSGSLQNAKSLDYEVSGNILVTNRSRMIIWAERGLSFKALIWNKGTGEMWMGSAKKNSFNFAPTDLGLPPYSLSSLRISNAIFDSSRDLIYLTDQGNNNIVTYNTSARGRAKILITPTDLVIRHERIELYRPRVLAGLAVYSLDKLEMQQRLKTLFKDSWAFVASNRFLVIVDVGAQMLITVRERDRSLEVLPLVGFSDCAISLKDPIRNLLTQKLSDVEEIIEAPDGMLLFGRYGSADWYVLNPKIAIGLTKVPSVFNLRAMS